MTERAPQERRARHRQRLGMVKAAVGVAVLVVVATTATIGAVHTVSLIAHPNDTTRLQRYIDGHDRVLVTSRAGHFKVAFPDQPTPSSENVHVLFKTYPAQRLMTPVGSDTVEVVWFSLPATVQITDPQSTLATFAPFLAVDLHGTPQGGEKVAGASPVAYEFTVPESSSRRPPVGDYHVRVLLSGHRVWILRVQTRTGDGTAALHALARSFQFIK